MSVYNCKCLCRGEGGGVEELVEIIGGMAIAQFVNPRSALCEYLTEPALKEMT